VAAASASLAGRRRRAACWYPDRSATACHAGLAPAAWLAGRLAWRRREADCDESFSLSDGWRVASAGGAAGELLLDELEPLLRDADSSFVESLMCLTFSSSTLLVSRVGGSPAARPRTAAHVRVAATGCDPIAHLAKGTGMMYHTRPCRGGLHGSIADTAEAHTCSPGNPKAPPCGVLPKPGKPRRRNSKGPRQCLR
jgi:hypothetical protein